MWYLIQFTLYSLFISGLFGSVALAEVNIEQYTLYLPSGASLGFIAENINQNQIIAEHNENTFMLPASTQKVFTALAAKLTLGDNFQFETALLTNGEIQDNQLKGNLIVRFTGDPDLTSGQLYQLLAELKKQGITKINGNLILDTSVFASHDRAPGWIWNDLTMCFNAPPAAVNIDSNCFSVNLDARGSVGDLVKFNVPSQFPMQVFGQVRIVDQKDVEYCQLDAIVHDNNRYQIKGCLGRQSQPFGLSFAVQDPDAYAMSIIQRQLSRLGIEFTGKVQQPYVPQQGKLLAQHLSPPLPVLLKKMMKKSDNQIADALFRSIAYQYYQRPASFRLGTLAIKQILGKVGIKLGDDIIVDGSGLSRHNLVSPTMMLQALDYIARHENELHLMETFPIAGVDGTLSGRASMIQAPLIKNIHAKTGSLKGVYNLAGFMTNSHGEQIGFVQFINGYSTGNLESKMKRVPLIQFENHIYNALFSE